VYRKLSATSRRYSSQYFIENNLANSTTNHMKHEDADTLVGLDKSGRHVATSQNVDCITHIAAVCLVDGKPCLVIKILLIRLWHMASRTGEGFKASHWPKVLTEVQQHFLMLRSAAQKTWKLAFRSEMQGSFQPFASLAPHRTSFSLHVVVSPLQCLCGAMLSIFLIGQLNLYITNAFAEVAATVLVGGWPGG
jgi:hypothetical protein